MRGYSWDSVSEKILGTRTRYFRLCFPEKLVRTLTPLNFYTKFINKQSEWLVYLHVLLFQNFSTVFGRKMQQNISQHWIYFEINMKKSFYTRILYRTLHKGTFANKLRENNILLLLVNVKSWHKRKWLVQIIWHFNWNF